MKMKMKGLLALGLLGLAQPLVPLAVQSRSRPVIASASSSGTSETETSEKPKNRNPLAWGVLRLKLTEPAFTSVLNYEKRSGSYTCQGCGELLFDSVDKYDSRSGWPSFMRGVANDTGLLLEREWGGRVEVRCRQCNGHLGHVFRDGPRESQGGTGRRYCINGVAMRFTSRDDGANIDEER